VGRLYELSDQAAPFEAYVCYHDSVPQDAAEMAFLLACMVAPA